MSADRSAIKPWRSLKDFMSWAQDFSLRKKLLGGFLAVVVLVGVVTSFIGSRFVSSTIMERSQMRLSSDLATAESVLQTYRETMTLQIRLLAGSEKTKELLRDNDYQELRNRLAVTSAENDLEFLSIADKNGRAPARGFAPDSTGGDVSEDPLFKAALKGDAASAARLMSMDRLSAENPTIARRIGDKGIKEAMVLEAAHPIIVDGEITGVLYGGILLNGNEIIVERIRRLVFKGEVYDKRHVGFVTILQGDRAITTTVRGEDGLPRVGYEAGPAVRREVLDRGESTIDRIHRFGAAYLMGAAPIRDFKGDIIGAIQLGTLEAPINSVIGRLIATFVVVALLGVLLMGAIAYVLVRWINYPLERMVEAAKRAADGDLEVEVPVIAHDELGELASTFNVMIQNLAASRTKLEEWGKELASKVAQQTGELDQAREQVARVQKLASLEKMADGMSHIMAHISDPLIRTVEEEDTGSTHRILVMDADDKVRDFCKTKLEDEGFEVHTAATVREGFDHLEDEIFDVLVADIGMPELGGKELLKEIKYRQPDVLVIFTASFKSTEEAVEAVELGAFDYLPKPFGPHQITLMVYTALQTRQMVERTRREHASQRADKIFQRLPIALALADRAHRVVYNNRAFVELATKDGEELIRGKTFKELFGVDPLDGGYDDSGAARWLELEKVGRTAKLYNFRLPEEDLRVLMLLDVTDTVKKDQQADVLKQETLTRAQMVIHQQMRVAQEIAGLLGETTAETKSALFELIKLASDEGESR